MIENLQMLLRLMENYNNVFASEVGYDLRILQLEKKQETTEELLNRVFGTDQKEDREHNGKLIKIEDSKKLLYYLIQSWSLKEMLWRVDDKKKRNNYLPDLIAVHKENKGWRTGEVEANQVVENPISDLFEREYLKVFPEEAIAAYQIESNPTFWYGVYWEDYLFEYQDYYVQLSFSLSD